MADSTPSVDDNSPPASVPLGLPPSQVAALTAKLTGLTSDQAARTKFRMMQAFLPTFAHEVLRGPPEYGRRYLLGTHHIEWGKAVNAHSRILALAARDHGKCVAEGTPVLMADGRSIPVEEVRDGDLVMSYAAGPGLVPRRVEATLDSGIKPVITVSMSTGRRLTCTEDHKVRTVSGWVRAGDLSVGDRVLGTENLTLPDPVRALDDNEVALFAYVIAEGCTRGPRDWVRDNPEINGLADAKRVPASIMNAPLDQVVLFLSRFWACDGYMRGLGAEITLANERLIDDLRTLLHRIGVVACKTRVKVLSTQPTWRLAVQDAPNLLRLAQTLGPLIGKPEQTAVAIEAAASRRRQSSRVYRSGDGAAVLRVLAIEPAGEVPTHDLQIEGLSNFVCDHIVVHNSYFFIFAYAIWMASMRAPGRAGVVISATDRQAKKHLKKVRQEVEGTPVSPANPKLAYLLPFQKVNEHEIVFANDSSIEAVGFGTKVRGDHPFWVVGDDMLNDEHIYSDLVREKGIDYFLSAIEPMVVPGGQLVVVGTPFHGEDLYAHLERTGEYHVMKHPAVEPVTGRALWPARYDERALGKKKKLLGSNLRWSREFLCQPISDDSSIFPSWLFEQAGIKQPYQLGLDGRHWQAQGFTCFMGVDLAISTSANADYFVCFVIAVCPRTSDYWIVDIQRGQGMGYQVQVDTIVSLAKAYDCQFVFIESNQFQRVISDMTVRESDAPIMAFYTTGRGGSKQATTQRKGIAGQYSSNKNSLDRGVPALRMLLENRKLRIPWAPETQERVQTWITEMSSFAFVQGKMQGVGAHDDTVMAFWMAERAAKHGGGFSVYFGPETAEEIVEDDGLVPTPMGTMERLELGEEILVPVEEPEPEPEPDYFGANAGPRRLPGMSHVVGGPPSWYNDDS